MNVVVCLDDKNGMLFHNRRQSKDRYVCDHLLNYAQGNRLWMNAYSAAQFLQLPQIVSVAEDYLDRADAEDICFVENADLTAFAEKIGTIIVYRWNRVYPADVRLPAELLSARTLTHTEEFLGYSHDKITQEIYSL